jgi:hypothetical protein
MYIGDLAGIEITTGNDLKNVIIRKEGKGIKNNLEAFMSSFYLKQTNVTEPKWNFGPVESLAKSLFTNVDSKLLLVACIYPVISCSESAKNPIAKNRETINKVVLTTLKLNSS